MMQGIELSRVSSHASTHLPSSAVTPAEMEQPISYASTTTTDLLDTAAFSAAALNGLNGGGGSDKRFEALDSYPDGGLEA
ncbi:BQ2448_2621 [Microbotryum intermedium]|uniref:BQ2448_2621 protein n=1 Tax=Microbotryum intermedium TaxID=269621 RepID=A0A238FBX8_9BASI|nr:BQ2448_2621 [Microbotryum intermedium]